MPVSEERNAQTSGSDDINPHRLQLAAGVRTAKLDDSTSFTRENVALVTRTLRCNGIS